MLKQLIKKKFSDYFNINNREVRISLILTAILFYIAIKIDIYFNFQDVLVSFQNISIYIAAAILSMIGIILTGLALIIGVLDKNIVKEFDEVNKDTVNDLMLCFKFLIFNLGFSSILFFFIHFMLFVKIYIPKGIFYTILVCIIYYFIFLVFYTIDLISSSIDLYLMKNITDKMDLNIK